jgi:hypothetical protein
MQTTLTLLVCAPTIADMQQAIVNTNVSHSYCLQHAQQWCLFKFLAYSECLQAFNSNIKRLTLSGPTTD